jgi:hypothetical protein
VRATTYVMLGPGVIASTTAAKKKARKDIERGYPRPFKGSGHLNDPGIGCAKTCKLKK